MCKHDRQSNVRTGAYRESREGLGETHKGGEGANSLKNPMRKGRGTVAPRSVRI